jgi:hypothetical protein
LELKTNQSIHLFITYLSIPIQRMILWIDLSRHIKLLLYILLLEKKQP